MCIRDRTYPDKASKIGYLKALKISSVQITMRVDQIKEAGIRFDERYGAGTPNGSGEETIFLYDCLNKGLKVYYVPVLIGEVKQTESTWFQAVSYTHLDVYTRQDKNYTVDFFESCGLKAPRTVNDYHLYHGPYPCFIKPKDGSSSINAFKVENESELKVYAEQVGDYIVQPFIEGTEYTVDIFCDYEGNPIYITPRIRVAVRAGEVLKTEIAMDETIIAVSYTHLDVYKRQIWPSGKTLVCS